jgi:hypothetical protein
MDISKVLDQLRKELEHLDAAIVSLERLQEKGRRRGRPPKAASDLNRHSQLTRPKSRRQIAGGENPE